MPRPVVRAFLTAIVALLIAAPPVASRALAAPTSQETSEAQPAAAAKTVKTTKTAKTRKKHARKRIPRGVGFLPGYRTPEQIERDQYMEVQRERRAYYRAGGRRIAYWRWRASEPQFYRGRWNGGSFGPCWTVTPIGYQWNCGK